MFINHICKVTHADTQALAVFLHLTNSPLAVVVIMTDIQPDGLLLRTFRRECPAHLRRHLHTIDIRVMATADQVSLK